MQSASALRWHAVQIGIWQLILVLMPFIIEYFSVMTHDLLTRVKPLYTSNYDQHNPTKKNNGNASLLLESHACCAFV